jgi:hypothetical protein
MIFFARFLHGEKRNEINPPPVANGKSFADKNEPFSVFFHDVNIGRDVKCMHFCVSGARNEI